jgi:hypothetical protein
MTVKCLVHLFLVLAGLCVLSSGTRGATVSLGFASSNAVEGTSFSIPVRLSATTNRDVTVNYSRTGGTANNNLSVGQQDYISASGSVTIRAGSLATNIIISTLHTSALDEEDETITFALSAPVGYTLGSPSACTLTLLDDPNDGPPTLQWTGSTGGQESVTAPTITLSANSGKPITVSFSASGTATSGADFNLGATTLTIQPERGGANIPLTIVNDGLDEDSETVELLMTSAVNANLPGTAGRDHTYTITDNDNPPTMAFSSAGTNGTENLSASASIVLSAPSSKTITATLGVAGSTAKSTNPNRDYSLSTATFTLPPGQTSTNITIQVVNDTRDEPDETVVLSLNNVVNATETSPSTFTYTIRDNDDPPTVSFLDNVGSAFESNAPLVVVQLSQTSDLAPAVDYAVVGGTATAGDFDLPSGTLTFGPTNLTLPLPLTLVDDGVAEPDETLLLQLSSPTNAALGTLTTSLFTIQDTGVSTTAPRLNASPLAGNQVTISWTPATPGFVLQETLSLSPVNWSNAPSGPTNPVTVPATSPAKVFRLLRP